ncbi:MAG: GreA/GreB family elongation factor [Verrucomicrobiota bacterium JB023]|nr:GreA/GreB family elongation factor [Verrucomicrobiota bacterium JB023]
MHPDVAKFVDAGRIPEAVGLRLSELAPGCFCLHKSWGAGKVKDWDLFGGKVTIDFERAREPQVMGLQLAIQKTEKLESDDFRAERVDKLPELRALADSEPTQLIVRMLESHGGSLKPDQVDREICGTIVPEEDYKKWWDKAKRAARESGLVIIPSKRTEPLVLRDTSKSPLESLVSEFQEARDLKAKTAILDALKNEADALNEQPEAFQQLSPEIDNTVKKGLKLNLGPALDLLACRDELVELVEKLALGDEALRIENALVLTDGDVAGEITSLPAARQRRIYESFPIAYGDEWVDKILRVFDRVGTRGVSEISKMLESADHGEKLAHHIKKGLSLRTISSDALVWICRERKNSANDHFGPEVGFAMMSAIDAGAVDDGPRKGTKLQNLLMDDKTLVADLLGDLDLNEARNFARKLLQSPAFAELDRKSLMARVIRSHPETQDLVTGAAKEEKDEALVVSWESLERRKAEYEDLVKNKIPKNLADKKLAASYGDFRENFEYHAAKETERKLHRQRQDMERELGLAQGTDFSNTDASQAGIGTVVTVETESGQEREYTILGAWDSDPENNVLPYLSESAQVLIGHKVGDEVEMRDMETDKMGKFRLKDVRAWKS